MITKLIRRRALEEKNAYYESIGMTASYVPDDDPVVMYVEDIDVLLMPYNVVSLPPEWMNDAGSFDLRRIVDCELSIIDVVYLKRFLALLQECNFNEQFLNGVGTGLAAATRISERATELLYQEAGVTYEGEFVDVNIEIIKRMFDESRTALMQFLELAINANENVYVEFQHVE